MPRRIVRQPNGLYAEFSTIVDTFTVINMTEEEAYTHCRKEMGERDAKAKVKRAVRDEKYYTPPPECGNGTWRWRNDLSTVKYIHGKKAKKKLKKLASIPADEWQKMYEDGIELPEGMEWHI